MSEPTYATVGGCVDWITADDVMQCCGVTECDPPSLFDTVAHEAGLALYEISGRQFNGICERSVRPCGDRCGCWGYGVLSTPWFWTFNYSTAVWSWWNNDCGDRCGCTPLEKIPLAGYPVQEIVQVLIDGAVVDPSTYRLDNRRELVRMDDPGPPVVKQYWPGCQNLALESDQPGTFEITYRWGMEPPEIARNAAADLACQLFQACAGAGGNCVLPAGVTRVDRLGITIERSLLNHWLDPTQPTGLANLDLFLRAYWGGTTQRKAAVWSPDVRGYGIRVG